MTKSGFIKKLREELRILDSKEIEDIIAEYTYHIDRKIDEGLSEEQAVEELGDVAELAEGILAAYHIQSKPKTVEDYFQRFLNYLKRVTETILKMENKQLVSFVTELLLVLFVLLLLNIPFRWLLGLLGGVFSVLTLGLFKLLAGVFYFIFELLYWVISIYIVYLFIDRRLLNAARSEEEKNMTEDVKEEVKEEVKEATKSSRFKAPGKKDKAEKIEIVAPENPESKSETVAEVTEPEVEKNAIPPEKAEVLPPEKPKKKTPDSVDKGAGEFFMPLVKLLLGIFVWLPGFAILLVCLVALGVAIALVVTTLSYLWVLFVVTGIFMIAMAVVVPVHKLIWGKVGK